MTVRFAQGQARAATRRYRPGSTGHACAPGDSCACSGSATMRSSMYVVSRVYSSPAWT